MPKIEIYQDKRMEWRWHLKAENGWIIADSGEGYTRRADARKAAENARELMVSAKIVFVRKKTK